MRIVAGMSLCEVRRRLRIDAPSFPAVYIDLLEGQFFTYSTPSDETREFLRYYGLQFEVLSTLGTDWLQRLTLHACTSRGKEVLRYIARLRKGVHVYLSDVPAETFTFLKKHGLQLTEDAYGMAVVCRVEAEG